MIDNVLMSIGGLDDDRGDDGFMFSWRPLRTGVSAVRLVSVDVEFLRLCEESSTIQIGGGRLFFRFSGAFEVSVAGAILS